MSDPIADTIRERCERDRIAELEAERDRYREALQRLCDCDWSISLPDRMDAVRDIAREALAHRGPQPCTCGAKLETINGTYNGRYHRADCPKFDGDHPEEDKCSTRHR